MNSPPRDIVVSWPKRRSLDSYLGELRKAQERGLVINYRVSRPPKVLVDRCYIIYDGFVRGYSEIIEVVRRGHGEVNRVDKRGEHWPPGWYVVRKPVFVPVEPTCRMRGFQGWRYFDRKACDAQG